VTETAGDRALLPDAVYQRLRDDILAGAIPPGTSLSVPRLAAQLGTSRTPAREAVQRLIADGLAVHVPHAGARVVELDEGAVRDVLTVREALDGIAARQAAILMTADEIDALRETVTRQEGSLADPADQPRDVGFDLDFHGQIRAAARNPTLNDALKRIEALAHLHGSRLWQNEEHRRSAAVEHRRIYEAISTGDPEGARRAAEAHVRAIARRLR
jgi:DNA-binding GntR family transcriptional regulator